MSSDKNSGRVSKIYDKAKSYVGNNERLKNLSETVLSKLNVIEKNDEERESFINHVKVFIRMIKAHIAGEYRSFSPKTLLIFIFALVYFVTPTDLMPDFIPVLGLTDDISLVYYVVKSFAEDIEEFLEWELSE